jgi:hypothetical protein
MGDVYKANLTAGGLLVPESRKIADLMIREVDESVWRRTIQEENILQARSVASAIRKANLIRARLSLMTKELWLMVKTGDSTLSTQAIFATAIKHSRILGDYLDLVVRDQFRSLEDRLRPVLWEEFISSCKQRDPLMRDFPPSTAKKMRTMVHNILREVGYLTKSKRWELKKIEIVPELLDYLERKNETYILKCIQVSK